MTQINLLTELFNLNYYIKFKVYVNMKNVFKVILAMLLLGTLSPYQVKAEVSKVAAEKSSQQQKERLLRGSVTDKEGYPLPGVAITYTFQFVLLKGLS